MIHFITKDNGFNAEGISTYTEIPSLFYEKFDKVKIIPSDTETTGLDPYRDKLLLLIMHDGNESWVIDCRTIDASVVADRYKNKKWVFHNAQFDLLFINWHLKTLLQDVYCTFEQEKLLDNRDWTVDHYYGLAHTLKRRLKVEMSKEVRQSFINKPDLDPFTPEEIVYAADDTEYLLSIHKQQEKEIKQRNKEYLVYLERRFIVTAVRMASHGLTFDTVNWRKTLQESINGKAKYDKLLREELKRLSETYPKLLNQRYKKYKAKNVFEHEAHKQLSMFDDLDPEAVLNQINFNSSQHIHKILNACGVSVANTEADTLKRYRVNNLDTPLYEFIQLLVGDEGKYTPCYKMYDKRISTYGESFIKKNLHKDGKIRTSFGLILTKTGRLSSAYPNMQNIPAVSAFRHCFVAESGYEIYTIDYSGCELAICAEQSSCPIVTATLNEGADLHSMMATVSYRIIKDDPDFVVSKSQNNDLRTKHKPVLFGILYGAEAERIAEVLSIPLVTAKKIYDALQKALPQLFAYLEESAKFARTRRFIYSNKVTNRTHRYVDRKKSLSKISKEAKNYRMQATNADMIKEAICTCQAWIDDNNVDCKILLTVHDEIVFQAPIGERWIADKLVELMEQVAHKYVPSINLKAECDIYGSWVKGLKKEEQQAYFAKFPTN